MSEAQTRRAAVIGGGAWGSALAIHLARTGRPVSLWIREADLVQRLREQRDNPVYLPGVRFPDAVCGHADLAETVAGASLVVGVVPSQFARSVYRELAPHLPSDVPVVLGTKGIEGESLALPLDVAREELGPERPMAVLSGPSFAAELARGLPTALVLAAEDGAWSRAAQHELSSNELRVYTNADPVGVQVAGALKNVIALAAGMADSLEMGANAGAALITRGLSEISRLGMSLGGQAATFAGLAGLGDLVLTCTGDLSRNRTVGRRIGRGERLEDILAGSPSVPEGVRTTRAAHRLAARQNVAMPIVEELRRILDDEISPQEALRRLMSRPLISEATDVSGPEQGQST